MITCMLIDIIIMIVHPRVVASSLTTFVTYNDGSHNGMLLYLSIAQFSIRG
jgi:hypothetical protein